MSGFEDEPRNESVKHSKSGYFLPASLVNKIILSIVGSIIAIGMYMIGWAYNDVQWKTEQEQKFDRVEDKILSLDAKVVQLPPPWLTAEVALHREQIRELNGKVTKLETEHASGIKNGR